MQFQPEDGLTADEIQALQEAAWAETYRWVMARSRFYQEHLRRAGFSATDRPTLAALQRIPSIDKDRLSREAESFLCVPRREVAEWVTTSGSTGEPLNYPMSARDLERLGANEELSFRCAGLTGDETVLLAVSLDRCFIAGLAYYLGLRRLGCAVVRGGPATPALHVNLLRQMRPEVIVAVPSFLCRIADTAHAAAQSLSGASIQKAVCIGEPIREPDGTLNSVGTRIATEWRAEVYSTYGMTELACSLCECRAGQGGHLHPALLYLEVLDDDGQPVPEGEVGELTATTFGVEALPLVRYRTGDCAALRRGRCPCGRETLRIGPIVGRKGQKLKLKGTTVFPSTLARVLDTAEGVTSYVVVARRGTDLSDRVEVRVACGGDPAQVLERLRERFRGEARVTPELSAASAESIEALQLPAGARKRRFFVDQRSDAR
jgi:phenylacetate-CoA ligase